MTVAEQIAEALEPFLGAPFDAKAEKAARKAIADLGLDAKAATFSAGSEHRDGPEPPAPEESREDYQARIAEWEALPRPGIVWLAVEQLAVTVGEGG